MQIPTRLLARPNRGQNTVVAPVNGPMMIGDRRRKEFGATSMGSIAPAGCCAEVCVPGVGCHCVAQSPFC